MNPLETLIYYFSFPFVLYALIVGVLIALCATRKLLLLDEPAAGLDPKVTAGLYDLVARLNRQDGITILMISHDMGAAVQYASRILHLGEGRQLFLGTAAEYRTSPAGQLFDLSRKGGEGA